MPATAALVQAHRNSRDQGSCQSASGCASTTLTLLQLAQRIAAQRCTPVRPYRQPLACRWRGRNPHSDVQSPVPSFPRVPSLRAFVRRPLAAAVGFGMGRHPKASTDADVRVALKKSHCISGLGRKQPFNSFELLAESGGEADSDLARFSSRPSLHPREKRLCNIWHCWNP